MTEGKISRQIVVFSIPIILGNIFQQLYNTTDAIIVGRLIGKDAFAAVSVANPIMSVVLFFLVGLTMGVGVLLSQQYGAGQRDKFRVQFSTGLIGGIVFTLAVAAVCIPLSGLMLRAAQTPGEILGDWLNIIGICDDIKFATLRSEITPIAYVLAPEIWKFGLP